MRKSFTFANYKAFPLSFIILFSQNANVSKCQTIYSKCIYKQTIEDFTIYSDISNDNGRSYYKTTHRTSPENREKRFDVKLYMNIFHI